MNFKKIVKLFENGNVSVSGLRGRGKDMLMSNVIARRKNLEYVSNIDYGYKYNEFRYKDFDVPNTFKNFITNELYEYRFPFSDKTDLYLSDCGIYFPSQYQKELCKMFEGLTTFQALSRQLGLCNVHTNSQYLGRVWDKIREQSDTYIVCQSCKVFFGKIVIQKIRIYEKYESALNNVAPFRMRVPLFSISTVRSNVELAKTQYTNTHGIIKSHYLVYINKGKYDTRVFKSKLLKGVEKNEKKS